jgi:hypothetical protein
MREQMVGRAGAVVPDPLNQYLELLGDYAQSVDDLATDLGRSVAAQNDHELGELLADDSLRESEPIRRLAELTRAWQAPSENALKDWVRATGELLLLEDMGATTSAEEAELAQALADARARQRDADREGRRAHDAYRSAGQSLDSDENFDRDRYDAVRDE